jgi:hypothetical protein
MRTVIAAVNATIAAAARMAPWKEFEPIKVLYRLQDPFIARWLRLVQSGN